MILITEKKIIPSEDNVFYRVFAERIRRRHRIKVLSENYIPPKVFQNEDDDKGMSVDWAVFRSPNETLEDHGTKRPHDDFGVISMIVGKICNFKDSKISVIHDPDTKNEAHSLISGFPSNIQRDSDPRLKLIQTNLRNYFSNPINEVSKWELYPNIIRS